MFNFIYVLIINIHQKAFGFSVASKTVVLMRLLLINLIGAFIEIVFNQMMGTVKGRLSLMANSRQGLFLAHGPFTNDKFSEVHSPPWV